MEFDEAAHTLLEMRREAQLESIEEFRKAIEDNPLTPGWNSSKYARACVAERWLAWASRLDRVKSKEDYERWRHELEDRVMRYRPCGSSCSMARAVNEAHREADLAIWEMVGVLDRGLK